MYAELHCSISGVPFTWVKACKEMVHYSEEIYPGGEVCLTSSVPPSPNPSPDIHMFENY